MSKAKDWTGQKHGRLTFIRPTNRRRSGILWEAKCECGKITTVRPIDAVNGKTISCGCYQEETASANGRTNGYLGRVYEPRISSARHVWRSTYKPNARGKGEEGCDFDTFLRLSQENCYYCNRPPYKSFNVGLSVRGTYKSERQIVEGNFIYNGLDRLDSNRGHTPDNVVPCCHTCNWMKMALGVEEFLAHIERIYNHRGRIIRSLPLMA